MRQLQRDPFARMTLMREVSSHKGGSHSCDWCGQSGKTLYWYWWESDSGGRTRGLNLGREFCSVGCYRSFTS